MLRLQVACRSGARQTGTFLTHHARKEHATHTVQGELLQGYRRQSLVCRRMRHWCWDGGPSTELAASVGNHRMWTSDAGKEQHAREQQTTFYLAG
eukprot:358287-Chlamydomonas_euryale.AAC.14